MTTIERNGATITASGRSFARFEKDVLTLDFKRLGEVYNSITSTNLLIGTLRESNARLQQQVAQHEASIEGMRVQMRIDREAAASRFTVVPMPKHSTDWANVFLTVAAVAATGFLVLRWLS